MKPAILRPRCRALSKASETWDAYFVPVSGTARAVVFVRAQIHQGRRMAVVAGLQRDHVVAVCERAGQAEGEFVGFAAGVYEEAYAKGVREQGR